MDKKITKEDLIHSLKTELINKKRELKKLKLKNKELENQLTLAGVGCSEITDSDIGKEFVVIKRLHGHEFKIGSVVRLKEIHFEDDGFCFVNKKGDWWMLEAYEVKRKEE